MVCVCQRHRVLSPITGILVSSASVKVTAVDVHTTRCIGDLLVDATTTRRRIEPVLKQAGCRWACGRHGIFHLFTRVSELDFLVTGVDFDVLFVDVCTTVDVRTLLADNPS